MRPDGTLESWDELPLLRFKRDLYQPKFRERNADISDVTGFIFESLLDYQTWFIQEEPGDPMQLTMPFAWYLAEGDLLANRNIPGVVYRVERVELLSRKHHNGVSGAKVQLSAGPPPPSEGQCLEFVKSGSDERHAANYVRFTEIDSPVAKDLYVSTQNHQEEVARPWIDTITYFLSRREPGATDGRPFSDPKMAKPQHRSGPVTEDGRFQIEVKGQWFDNLLQFDVFGQDGRRADRLIGWFEHFLQRYTWVWLFNGVQQILYWQRGRDQNGQDLGFRQDLSKRTLRYFFRTERLWATRTRKLEAFEVSRPSTRPLDC